MNHCLSQDSRGSQHEARISRIVTKNLFLYAAEPILHVIANSMSVLAVGPASGAKPTLRFVAEQLGYYV